MSDEARQFQDHVRTCGRCRVPCRFHAVGCPETVSPGLRRDHRELLVPKQRPADVTAPCGHGLHSTSNPALRCPGSVRSSPR